MRLKAQHADMGPHLRTSSFAIAGLGEPIANLFALPGGGEEALVVLHRVLSFSFSLAFAVTFASAFASTSRTFGHTCPFLGRRTRYYSQQLWQNGLAWL